MLAIEPGPWRNKVSMRCHHKYSYEVLIFAEEIDAALKAAADAYYAANPTEAVEEVTRCSCCCKGVE